MKDILIWVIAGVLLVLSQVMILAEKMPVAVLLLSLDVLIVLFMFLKSNREIRDKFDFRSIAAIISVLLAITATMLVRTASVMSLYVYIAAALFLLFSRPAGHRIFEEAEIKTEPAKMEKWEPVFFVVLFTLTFLSRVIALGDIPAGVEGGEIVWMGDAMRLANDKARYFWHLGSGAEWPSMTTYQSIIFGKIFGWNLGNLRLEGAFWGIAMVITLYFLIRRMFSPLTAAFAAVIFSFSESQIMISRYINPIHIMYTCIIVATWLFIEALRNKKWYVFALSGLFTGLSIHGYLPGRILPAILALLCIYVWLFDRKHGLKFKHLMIMFAGVLVSAGPIAIFAWKEPELYWGYLRSVNPNAHTGAAAYIQTFFNNIKDYAGAFHVRGGANPSLAVACKPLLDPVAQVLFPIGLFLSVFMIFKPYGIFFVVFFIFTLLPSMLGQGNSGHPAMTRIMGAFPAIYLMIAFAYERLKNVFVVPGKKFVSAVFIAVSLMAAVFASYNGFADYFEMQSKRDYKIGTAHSDYIVGKEVDKTKNANVIISANLHYWGYVNSDRVFRRVLWPDELLILDPERENLLIIDPIYKGTSKFFSDNFPNASIKQLDFKPDTPEYACGGTLIYDIHAPDTSNFTVRIPAEDVKRFQQFVDASTGEKVDIASEEFIAKYAGKSVTLLGAVIITEREKNAVIKSGKKGWQISLGSAGFTESAEIPYPGVHYFKIKGNVDKSMNQNELVSVMVDGVIVNNRVFGMKKNYGLRMDFYKSEDPDKLGRPVFSKNILLPAYRVYDGYAAPMGVPFIVVYSAFLNVQDKASISISTLKPSESKITVNGRVIYNSLNSAEKMDNILSFNNKDGIYGFKCYNLAAGGPIGRTAIFKSKKEGELNYNYMNYDDFILSK